MLTVEELKKLDLNIRRTFRIEIENIVSKNSPDYDDREGVEIRMYPVLHIAAFKGDFSDCGENNFIAAISCETEDISYFIGTTFDMGDLESDSACFIVKSVYFEKNELPVVYDGLFGLDNCEIVKTDDHVDLVRNELYDEYDCFFSDLLWDKAEYYKENVFLQTGCEEWCDAIRSAVQNAILNSDNEEERRVLSEVFANSL